MEHPEPIAEAWLAFDPAAYLHEYYQSVSPENQAILAFLHDVYNEVAPDAIVLDVCCGPTVYQMISAAPRIEGWHACDMLKVNLDHLAAWQAGTAEQFRWDPFVAAVLALEGVEPNQAAIADRTALMRAKLQHLFQSAVQTLPAQLAAANVRYDVLSSCFGLEAAVADVEAWRQVMAECAGILRPGGRLIMLALTLDTPNEVEIGGFSVPVVSITDELLRQTLPACGFDPRSIKTVQCPADHPDTQGYSGLIFVTALRDQS